MGTVFGVLISVIGDMLRWLRLAFRSTKSIEAENLFLRRPPALYVERGITLRRIDPATRIHLASYHGSATGETHWSSYARRRSSAGARLVGGCSGA